MSEVERAQRANERPEPASLARSCPRSVPPVANAPVVRMTKVERARLEVRAREPERKGPDAFWRPALLAAM